MKKIKILIAVLIIGISVQGQFASTAELKTYIDQYITNNAINAFQNKRLNTALKGLASQIDSASAKAIGGVRVVDTMYLQLPDSLLTFRIKNNATGASTTYQLPVGTGGGGSGGPTLIEDYGVDINPVDYHIKADTTVLSAKYLRRTDSTIIYKDASIDGAGTVDQPLTVRQIVKTNTASLRTLIPDTGTVYRVIDRNGRIGDFTYNPDDAVTPDDSVMNIRGIGFALFRRQVDNYINLKDFGAIGDGAHDDTQAWDDALRYIYNQNTGLSLFVPTGDYKITREIYFKGNINASPRILGEQKGHGGSGATLVWYGPAGGTMMRLEHMVMTSIENLDFLGGGEVGGVPRIPKYGLHFDYTQIGNFSTGVLVNRCTFARMGGDSSAGLNINATGAFSNYQVDEMTIQECHFLGEQIRAPLGDSCWWGTIIGGSNTKNFLFSHNFGSYLHKAAIKTMSSAGQIVSMRNLWSTCEYTFDLSNGTNLISDADYSESNGALMKSGTGPVHSSYIIKNYLFHADNYEAQVPGYPTTHEFVIETGKGQLILEGCTFATGSHIPKINWTTEDGLSSVTVKNSYFSGIGPGASPFYSSGNNILTQDREADGGQLVQQRFSSIDNVGLDSSSNAANKRFPNSHGEDIYVRGFNKISAYTAKPTASTDQKRWYANDYVVNIIPAQDSRSQPKGWIVTQSGTFKTINVTGTRTAGSVTITGISDITQFEKGDLINISVGFFGGATYPHTVAAVGASSISLTNIVGYQASGSGAVTITNAVPKFAATGGSYGTSGNRPTLDIDDKGFQYLNTNDSSLSIWTGNTWVSAASAASQWVTSGSNIYYTAGNVGIGTSSTPRAKLDIDDLYVGVEGSRYGAINSGNDLYINANADNAGIADGSIFFGKNRSYTSGGTTLFTIDATGQLTAAGLTGTGSRPVVASATGVLSRGEAYVTQSALNDTSVAIRAAIGGGGGSSQWTTISGTEIGYSNNVIIGAVTAPRGGLDVRNPVWIGTPSSTHGIVNSHDAMYFNYDADNVSPSGGFFKFGYARKTAGASGTSILNINYQGMQLLNGTAVFGDSSGTGVRGLVDVRGIMYLGINGAADAVLDSDDDLYINVDANNNGGGGSLILASGRTSTSGGTAIANFNTTAGSTFSKLVTTPHIAGSGAAPGIAAGTGAGTGPTVSMMANSTDLAGEISVLTGTSPSAATTIVTITFNVGYGTTPFVVFSPSNAASADVNVYLVRVSTTQFQLAITAVALTAATTYKWTYSVVQ